MSPRWQHRAILTSSLRWLGLALVLLVACARADEHIATPAELYGELFEAVQLGHLYSDGKTFVDQIPDAAPADILALYRRSKSQSDFDLRAFVTTHFKSPPSRATAYRSDSHQNVRAHIDALWPVLTRPPDDAPRYSSLLPLPKPYVVPGGRFTEIYYWDSYFTMLGLEASGRHDLVADMVDNFAALIERFGHIPNGNRSYYLSRSQPPFFAAMVDIVAAHDGEAAYRRYLPQLAKEYAFWMEGADTLATGTAHRRLVRLKDGTLLNRYWDDRDTPREESYAQDVATAAAAGRDQAEVYRNLRAAAESGWDFGSRWLADGKKLSTIQTVDYLPVDLNSLLYHLEITLAKSYRIVADPVHAAEMQRRAAARNVAMNAYLWNDTAGVFVDYVWPQARQSDIVSAASLYPLYFDIATRAQAKRTARIVRSTLLARHGLLTTPQKTGEQWDAPNGWAPLQWIAINALREHGEPQLAATLAQRWMAKNIAVYRATGKLVEKYDVVGTAAAGGGEYPLQDGFGWTNGVLRKLLTLYSP